jgi:hypothetical protein
MVSETAMDIDELIARFEMGGEWKVRQICKMTGWSRSMIYRYVAEGKIPQSSIIRGQSGTTIEAKVGSDSQATEGLNHDEVACALY